MFHVPRALLVLRTSVDWFVAMGLRCGLVSTRLIRAGRRERPYADAKVGLRPTK